MTGSWKQTLQLCLRELTQHCKLLLFLFLNVISVHKCQCTHVVCNWLFCFGKIIGKVGWFVVDLGVTCVSKCDLT